MLRADDVGIKRCEALFAKLYLEVIPNWFLRPNTLLQSLLRCSFTMSKLRSSQASRRVSGHEPQTSGTKTNGAKGPIVSIHIRLEDESLFHLRTM